MDSVNVRVLIVAAVTLTGCEPNSPLDPIDRAARIEAASAVDFSGVVGSNSPTIVRVTDKHGHPLSDVPVTFTVTPGGGSVSPTVVMTDVQGLASATWIIGTTVATHTLKAGTGTLEPVVFTATAVAGPPAGLERAAGDNQIVAVGAVAATPLKARVVDSFRNPLRGVSVSFSVISGGGTITPGAVTDSAGVAAATWTLGPAEGVQTAQAQAAGFSVVFTADAYTCADATSVVPCPGLGELIVVRTDGHIYRINLDGTGLTRLTSEDRNVYPVWSPDGKRIAFTRYTSASGGPFTSDVYVMNADGSNVVRRTTGGQYYSLTWSPDGQRLAVDGATAGDSLNISVMSADVNGGAPTVLKTNAASPSWSPDGTKIVYASKTGYYDPSQIYVMNADGTGGHRATPDSVGWNWGPAWSPDGKKIAFTRCTFGCGVYTVDVASSVVTVVAPIGGAQDAEWSPDGRWLALTVYGSSAPSVNFVPSAGGNSRLVVSAATSPSWRPRTP